MDNPWGDLPFAPPYVLPMDAAAVDRAGCFRTDVVPEPLVGDPAAPVVILMEAPGFDDGDVPAHTRPPVAAAIRRSHTAGPGSFHPLEDALVGTPSERWWRPQLASLIAAIDDLRPVCPNCHAMIHVGGEVRTIEAMQELLRRGAG